jgi:hypothetical protein
MKIPHNTLNFKNKYIDFQLDTSIWHRTNILQLRFQRITLEQLGLILQEEQ